MKFNLREMFVWTGIAAFVCFVLRRPVVYLINADGAGGVFLNFYRHLGYVVGYDTPYAKNTLSVGVDLVVFLVALVSSAILHVALVFGMVCLLDFLLNWARRN